MSRSWNAANRFGSSKLLGIEVKMKEELIHILIYIIINIYLLLYALYVHVLQEQLENETVHV